MHLALNGIFRSNCNIQMAVKNANLNQNLQNRLEEMRNKKLYYKLIETLINT